MSFQNRVYDASVSKLVTWSTASPDTAGDYYPGPGAFGVDTTDFTSNKILGPDTTAFIVGSTAVTPEANLDDVTYLDSGNGVALMQAINAASDSGGGIVVLRGPVFVDLNLPGAPSFIDIPESVHVQGNTALFSGLNLKLRSTLFVDQVFVSGSLSGAFIDIPVPTDTMVTNTTDAYVIVHDTGSVESTVVYAHGEDYTVTSAGWQPARSLLIVNHNTRGVDVSVFSSPHTGFLLGDSQQACAAIRVGTVLS